MEKISPEVFFRSVERFILISIIVCSCLVFLFSRNIIEFLSFLIGGILGFINFRTTKKEGIDFINMFKMTLVLSSEEDGEKPAYKGEGILFLKTFLKLSAIAVIIYFLLKLSFNIVYILLGFTLVYFVLTLMTLRILSKREII